MSNIRESILEAKDIDSEVVTVPEWGDVVIELRGMTAGERANISEKSVTESGGLNVTLFWPTLLVNTCYDPDTGERVFEESDIEVLLGKAATVVERLATDAMRLSGMSSDSESQAGKDSSGPLSEDLSSS